VSARRVASLTRRIIDQFRRDHRSLALLFAAPIFVLALLGWVLVGQASPQPRVVISVASAPGSSIVVGALEQAVAAAGGTILDAGDDEAAARQALADREADVAIVGTTTGGTDLLIITPGLNPAAEGGNVAAIQQALADVLRAQAPPQVAGLLPEVRHEALYGPQDANELDTLGPVFVGYFAYFFVFILTGISFLRERVGGTLERLMATPVTRGEIVLGYSIGFGIFATIQVALVMAFTVMRVDVPSIGPIPAFWIGLGVPVAGSPLLAYLIALLLGLGAVSLGIFLSTFARSELQILQFIPVVIIPQGLLGGIFWPIDSLPGLLEPVARALPITYAVEGLREVFIAGAGIGSATVQLDLAVLGGIAALFIGLAATTIRREVA
jgi:ABC-2 type transport system permease protein